MLIKPSLKSIFILLLFFWIYGNLLAQTRTQRINISGFVTDSQTGERLIGTNISLVGTKFGTTTNNFGYYNISTANQVTAERQFHIRPANGQSAQFNVVGVSHVRSPSVSRRR